MLAGFPAIPMAVALLVLGVIARQGRRYIQRGEASGFRPTPGPRPPVAVIIPVAGVYPGLKENLRSRLTQDYPDYQVIFAVRSAADPAVGVIRALLPDFPHARLVVCGPASGCSQKNHNLLGGLKEVGPEVEILVFGDANQTTPDHWLAALIQPLISREAPVSSSYHHVIPQDNRLVTLGRSFVVLMIYLGKGIASFDQPWGGSTAIKKQVFQDLQVDQLWSRTVVDDVTLAKKLQQNNIRMAAAAGAVLATPARETLASWENWFIRQIIYLKFYFPLPWALAGVGLFALLGLVLMSLGQLLLAALGSLSWGSAAPSGLFLLLLSLLLDSLRSLHPRPGSRPAFQAAAFLTLFLAAWCHARTWFTRDLRWRNLVYTVDRQGLVTHIQEV
jgi:ceramide glucosyltransferase